MCDLKAKNCFIHKIFETNCGRNAKQSTTGKGLFLFFKSFLLRLTKFLFWQEGWVLGYHSLKFWDFSDVFWFLKIVRRKLLADSWGNSYVPCLLLIIELRLTCSEEKENLLKHQKVSKCYETDCLQSFLLLLMHLLTAPNVKNSHFLARTYFIFLKNVLKKTWKIFNTKFWPQWKDRKSSYQVSQIIALYCNLHAPILG